MTTELSSYADLLGTRASTQQVAAVIAKNTTDLSTKIVKEVHELARYASHYTSMSSEWSTHTGLEHAYRSAKVVMETVSVTASKGILFEGDFTSGRSMLAWTNAAKYILGLSRAANPVKKARKTGARTVDSWYGSYTRPAKNKGRRGDSHGHALPSSGLCAEDRKQLLPGVSVRLYRRAVRVITHLEQRAQVLTRVQDREDLVRFAKTRFGFTITKADLTDEYTNAFVFYYLARMGERTAFTVEAQARPMDKLGEALLKRALAGSTVRVDVIGKVLMRKSILSRLSEGEKGHLLGEYQKVLVKAARLMDAMYDEKRVNMVVRRGDDSETWNAASRAFNQARTGLMLLVRDLSLPLLTKYLPGKTQALIASDVAHMHTLYAEGSHQDSDMFKDLPLPWKVVLGVQECTEEMVRNAAKKYNIDPDTTGWTAPYRQSNIEEVRPSPELVYGVSVGSPYLASILKELGVFSGRG